MSDRLKVGISDYKVSEAPKEIITLGLGSCVGIALYDKTSKRGGLSHIMLPDSTAFKNNIKIPKFADLAIPEMAKEIKRGRRPTGLVAKIAGGASMFNFTDNINGNIGQRNIEAVEKILRDMNIPILGKNVGGKVGRTMIVDLETFEVQIRMVNGETIKL